MKQFNREIKLNNKKRNNMLYDKHNITNNDIIHFNEFLKIITKYTKPKKIKKNQ